MGLLKSLRSAIHKKRNFSRKQRGGDEIAGDTTSLFASNADTIGGKRKRRRRTARRRSKSSASRYGCGVTER